MALKALKVEFYFRVQAGEMKVNFICEGANIAGPLLISLADRERPAHLGGGE